MDSDENFRAHYAYVTTPDEAKVAAQSQAKRIERSKKGVEITLPGTTGIVAGAILNLSGFRQGLSGRYKVVAVKHSLSRSGWTTTISGTGAA